MTLDATKLFKALFAALMVGLFALAVSAPVTVDTGSLTVKSALAAKGPGKDGNGGGNDGADDGTGDQGPGPDDGADDGASGEDGGGDDGTADQGPDPV